MVPQEVSAERILQEQELRAGELVLSCACKASNEIVYWDYGGLDPTKYIFLSL